MPTTDANIEDFLRKTEMHWFDVPGSEGTRRGVYGNLLEPEARRRGWPWHDIEQQLGAAVERHGGMCRPQEYGTLVDAVRDRLLRQTSAGWRRTTYYELPADYFRG